MCAHSGDHPVVVILRPLTVATTDGRGAHDARFSHGRMYPDTDARVSEQSGALTFCRRNDIVEAELDFSSLCCGRCVCRAPAGRQRSCPTVRTKPSTSSLIASEGSAAF